MNDTAENPQDMKEVAEFAEAKFVKIQPEGMQFQKEWNFLLQLLRNNKDLMSVAQETPRSVVNVITQSAALGLSLNPAEKEAYVISRNIKIADNKWEARLFFEPSYMGLNKIAIRSEGIEWVQARVVRQGGEKPDSFTDNGVGLRPTHVYDAFASKKERGDIVGAYCVAKVATSEGADYLTTIMNKEQLDSIKERSEAGKKGFGPWISDPEQMSMKAVMRNGFKTWPIKSQAMAQAVDLSNENEGFEPIQTSPELRRFTQEQKEYYDQCISNEDAIRMFCFLNSGHIEEGVKISLYNSFEPRPKEGPGKGQYQSIVNDLEEKGRGILTDCLTELEICATEDQDMAAKEILEDMPQEAIDYLISKSNVEVANFIHQCVSTSE